MKIHLVTLHGIESGAAERNYLVKSHTRAGAEKFVRAKLSPLVTATVPSQDQLVACLQAGVPIEDATAAPAATNQEPTP